ncbi:MAG: tRNA lysidine(34) synthetase TilS [Deltaproteobacteria bacterium]|nr:tRNA lysidine(34) synthetase TilS [Deltaproteobacteria bacterium]
MTIVAELVSRVVRTIREQQLFSPGDTLIVALSGGADSTALLDLLGRLPGFGLRLVAAHLNHCLRGAESDGDEQFCRRLAGDHGVPIEILRVDVKQFAASAGLNLEDAGRRARIAFLEQMREKYCAAAIVTAHHGDDQAETVLMRLLRGSGMTGLSGMQYRNRRGHIRPLLDVTRAEIERYLAELGLAWREDASNRDLDFLRNRIRHQLLPLLEQYNPAIRHTLTATAALLSDENALLDSLAEQAFEACWHSSADNSLACGIAEFRAHPPALQRRMLRHVCLRLAGNIEGFTLAHIESIRQLPDSLRPNARITLPQGIGAMREYDRIVLRLNQREAAVVAEDIIIPAPGSYRFPWGGSLEVETCATLVDFSQLPADVACFDMARTPFPWRVRSFRAGDRIVPFGMTGRKKVKDVFIDRKIPLSDRGRIPLVFCGDELIWIAGVCASESCRIAHADAALVKVEWHDEKCSDHRRRQPDEI